MCFWLLSPLLHRWKQSPLMGTAVDCCMHACTCIQSHVHTCDTHTPLLSRARVCRVLVQLHRIPEVPAGSGYQGDGGRAGGREAERNQPGGQGGTMVLKSPRCVPFGCPFGSERRQAFHTIFTLFSRPWVFGSGWGSRSPT